MGTTVITDLIGLTITSVDVRRNVSDDDGDEIIFTLSDGRKFRFYHEQECCEHVYIEDINGDWADLIGSPILVAEERVEEGETGDYEHYTWAFYTFRTIYGNVDLRWNGESTGHYSERASYGFVNEEGNTP